MRILSEKELAKELALSPWTVRRMRLQEGMPYFQVGTRIFYNVDNVFKWIELRETTASTAAPVAQHLQYGKLRQVN